jgi:hypothetical protein
VCQTTAMRDEGEEKDDTPRSTTRKVWNCKASQQKVQIDYAVDLDRPVVSTGVGIRDSKNYLCEALKAATLAFFSTTRFANRAPSTIPSATWTC